MFNIRDAIWIFEVEKLKIWIVHIFKNMSNIVQVPSLYVMKLHFGLVWLFYSWIEISNIEV